MTKKQFNRKMMQARRNLCRWAKQNGIKRNKITDRNFTPKWGTEITVGSYKGERLTSYAQAWDVFCGCLKDTDVLDGIN